jgi:hypothetical protein
MDVHKHISAALYNFNCYAELEGLNLIALKGSVTEHNCDINDKFKILHYKYFSQVISDCVP